MDSVGGPSAHCRSPGPRTPSHRAALTIIKSDGHPTKKKSAHKEKEVTMDASPTPGAQGPHPTAAIMHAFYRSEGWAVWIGRLCNLRHEMRLHQLLDEWEQKCLRQQRLDLKGGQT